MFYLILFNAFLLSHSTLCILFHSIIDLFVYLFIFLHFTGFYSITFHFILLHWILFYSISFYSSFPFHWSLFYSIPLYSFSILFFNSISFCYEVILKYFISFYSIPFHCILLCSIPVFFYSI